MEEEEDREEVVEVELEEEITTIKQSSTAMQQSCTNAQGNCFFPVNKGGEGGGEQDGG